MYQIEWDFKTWTELKASHETQSSAPVHDKYVMVLNCTNSNCKKQDIFIRDTEEISS